MCNIIWTPVAIIHSLQSGMFSCTSRWFRVLFTCVLFIIVTFYLIFSRSVNFSLGDKKAVDDDEVEKRLRPSFLYSTYVSYFVHAWGLSRTEVFWLRRFLLWNNNNSRFFNVSFAFYPFLSKLILLASYTWVASSNCHVVLETDCKHSGKIGLVAESRYNYMLDLLY